jgi:serine/threonine protein kinase
MLAGVADATNGGKADVWSAGVMLFAMLTGGLPFHDYATAFDAAFRVSA